MPYNVNGVSIRANNHCTGTHNERYTSWACEYRVPAYIRNRNKCTVIEVFVVVFYACLI